MHFGIDPPGGGDFLGHVEAGRGPRARARCSPAAPFPSREGELSGEVNAQHLDLAFLSGLIPRLRRTGGMLDGDVKLWRHAWPSRSGRATPTCAAGLFDVVGQGVYEDVGLDAKFSPKEVVIDRITGSWGRAPSAAILVASRRPPPDSDRLPTRIEFTGEVHLGDDESVRDRKVPGDRQAAAGGRGAACARPASSARTSTASWTSSATTPTAC